MVDSWLKPKEQLVMVVWAVNQLFGWFGFGLSLVKKDNSYLTNCPVLYISGFRSTIGIVGWGIRCISYIKGLTFRSNKPVG
ncbi:hypothetical protein BCV63_12405 [Cylindrospermopsis raciborskii CS-508]|uniref:Uncharacterized protein n=2 Tax=Cylindrospermopsis raciborskii TaxID=77022 RepID=A0A853M7B5_9CYAN|nr:hypothetical protein A9P98_02415 [Cylindrospermopsis raciborskii CS-505]OHY39627.1 hypothetical protein BCV63_12405 [Cylindrospermopsis raciborskii CS-508]PNJ91427.1 hypothetical protein CEP15_18085 [Cylindrospermopsis raciborskii C07]PNJ91699.1 hypothetical protein CEP13_16615 [Cylindrospermopsis raciborskii C03]PNJ96372.1 hypothetical protein CEP14_07785 [Cylindrospermopsis raciborskii C04]PNK12536.1 hypothetical protein CEP07_18300 [Cylindrospermopsis raciborskii S01]